MVVDPSTLERALTYLYTGKYDDAGSCFTGKIASTSSDEPCGSTGRDSDVGTAEPDNEEASSHLRHRSEAHERDAANSEYETAATYTEECDEMESRSGWPSRIEQQGQEAVRNCHGAEMVNLEPGCRSHRLRANALVYIFADYYDIPDLKTLAVKKFEEALEGDCEEGLAGICRLVYERAPSTASDLRSCLSHAIAGNGRRHIEDASFVDAALALPELLRDCFVDLIHRHETLSEEKDAAIGACRQAEEVAKDATQKGQEDKEKLVTQVNQARRCRHCSLENNVQFEKEVSYPGGSGYSFRCRCRTRY